MGKYNYDFHIHTCLSPCGDDDMTPNNIVGMAAISGCEIIAVTDHNTCKNAGAVMEAGKEAGIVVIPGMELCTSEEAHVVCLFETLEGAMEFDRYVFENMPHVKNRPEVFGHQRILSESDEPVGTLDELLIVASFISVNDVVEIVSGYGGAAFPAHVNRDSYSVIASLGAVPPEAGFKTAELTRDCDAESFCALYPELRDMLILRNSDAHYLESLAGDPLQATLSEKTATAVINAVRSGII